MRTLLILTVALCIVGGASGQVISYSTAGSNYTENFNSLNAGNGNVDLAWANSNPGGSGGTVTGWSLFNPVGGGTALTTYRSLTGNNTAGSFYSFGVTGINSNDERAIGGIGSGGAYFGSPGTGAIAGWITVGIQNNTGASLDSFTANFDGEQWRVANVVTQTMVTEYGFGATFNAVTTWNLAGASFDFTSPTLNAVNSALDGNQGSNRVANLGGTISSLNWVNGDILWIRYRETNDAGSDHGLAIDNFSFSAVSVPEPVAIVSISIAMLAGVYVVGRRFCKVVNNSDTDVVNA